MKRVRRDSPLCSAPIKKTSPDYNVIAIIVYLYICNKKATVEILIDYAQLDQKFSKSSRSMNE